MKGPDTTARAIRFLSPHGRRPEQVARLAVRGVIEGRAVVNVYWEAWLLEAAARLLPHRWVPPASRWFLRARFPNLG